jgi:periplasmic divalent cation tolerance protein
MKAGKGYRVVLVTCGTLTEARRIARKVVGQRLAACANIILSPVESYFNWKGKLDKAREYLLIIKTSSARLAELESAVKHLHSYDLPEFIALPIASGSRDYLDWLGENVSSPRE